MRINTLLKTITLAGATALSSCTQIPENSILLRQTARETKIYELTNKEASKFIHNVYDEILDTTKVKSVQIAMPKNKLTPFSIKITNKPDTAILANGDTLITQKTKIKKGLGITNIEKRTQITPNATIIAETHSGFIMENFKKTMTVQTKKLVGLVKKLGLEKINRGLDSKIQSQDTTTVYSTYNGFRKRPAKKADYDNLLKEEKNFFELSE